MAQLELCPGETMVSYADLAPRERETADLTKANLVKSYHPFSKSGHFVSAGVLVERPDGTYQIFVAANNEVGPTLFSCAEQGVIREVSNHIQEEELGNISCMILVDQDGSGRATNKPPFPCPTCRGWIAGLAKRASWGEHLPIYVFRTDLEVGVKTTIGVLLPHMMDFP